MATWNVNLYLKFGKERIQPAIDLISRIHIEEPRRVIDLGCGPGNSTLILRDRFPKASIIGLDNSSEMIQTAKEEKANVEWVLGDISTWRTNEPFDLIFSNAAFHWVKNHQTLLNILMDQVALGGALAFQIPSHRNSALHKMISAIANKPQWGNQFEMAKNEMTAELPSFYYDCLVSKAVSLEIWETEYYHSMENHQAIIDWISSTGLRPFLNALKNDTEKKSFIHRLKEEVSLAYAIQPNGKVLFPFKRLFAIAYR